MFLKNNVKADREDEVSLFKEKLFASPQDFKSDTPNDESRMKGEWDEVHQPISVQGAKLEHELKPQPELKE